MLFISSICNSIWLFKSVFITKVLFLMIGVAGLGLLVTLHEFGHFLFCKLFGIRTPSFSVGFGPRLFSKKIGDTEFALSAIPLGGYVEIAGTAEIGQGEQKEAYRSDSHSFNTKPYWQQLLVMLGGILFNLLFAYGAMTLVSLAGLPQSPFAYPHNAVPIVAAVMPESIAAKSGLQKGDTILAINGISLDNEVTKYHALIPGLSHTPLTFRINRDNTEQDVSIVTQDTSAEKTSKELGICFTLIETPSTSLMSGIKRGIQMTNERIVAIFYALKTLFIERNFSQLAGPIGIISITSQEAANGIKVLLLLLATISINLAVLNLLPLPVLDGGQILFYTIEAIIRKPLPIKIREYIHIVTWILVILLVIYLSAKDLLSIISPYLTQFYSLFN